MRQPPTQFVTVGSERVAFQVFGAGTTYVLDLKAFLSSVDAVWEHPGHLRIWQAWDQVQIIMLDHRGVGMSDALPDAKVGRLEERIEDVLAVLDAVGVGRVCVYAEYDGAMTAITLAAEHPERVDKLVLTNGIATGMMYGAPDDLVEELVADVRSQWGTGELTAKVSPDLANNMGMDFVARFERMAARPNSAAAFVRNMAKTDVRPLLGRVAAPTLVIYSGDLGNVTALSDSRELATEIPNARLFANQSSSFYWGGGAIDEAVTFMSGDRSSGERDLVTLLFLDLVNSSGEVLAQGDKEWRRTLDLLDGLTEDHTSRLWGHIINTAGDGWCIGFRLPSHAVRAALDLTRRVQALGVRVRAGVHSGEVERRENGDITGHNVNVAARIMSSAEPGQVVVSRTVADLLGAHPDYTLHDRGEHALKGVGSWQLFTVHPPGD